MKRFYNMAWKDDLIALEDDKLLDDLISEIEEEIDEEPDYDLRWELLLFKRIRTGRFRRRNVLLLLNRLHEVLDDKLK